MPKILIEPISIKTKGGLDAEINGIDPSDNDCVCGRVKTVSGWQDGCWNKTGIMRGGVVDTNINFQEAEFNEIVRLIEDIKN